MLLNFSCLLNHLEQDKDWAGGEGSTLGSCTLSITKYLVENFATVDPFLPNAKVYSEPCQTSKMERFAKLVNTSTEHFNKIIV